MEIRKIDNTNFGNLTKTPELIEALLQKNFKSEGIDSVKKIMKDLYPNQQPIGAKSYRYYSNAAKKLVKEQHPELYTDIEKISEYIKQNPNITKPKLAEFVEPYIKKYGENIDIKI